MNVKVKLLAVNFLKAGYKTEKTDVVLQVD